METLALACCHEPKNSSWLNSKSQAGSATQKTIRYALRGSLRKAALYGFGWPGRCPKGTCALSISLSPVSVGESPPSVANLSRHRPGWCPPSFWLMERNSMQAAALGTVAFSFDAFTLQTAQMGRFYNLLTYSKYEMSVGIVFPPILDRNGMLFFSKGIFCVCIRMETGLKSLGTVYIHCTEM